jgi:hypothetical protein
VVVASNEPVWDMQVLFHCVCNPQGAIKPVLPFPVSSAVTESRPYGISGGVGRVVFSAGWKLSWPQRGGGFSSYR